MPLNPLRDYQEEDVALILEEFKTSKSTLYHAATGLGKTRVVTEVAKRMLPKRTLFLCHRSELIFQTHRTFTDAGIECQIEKAELIASTNLFTRSPAVLASVQTMLSGEIDKKRMARFKPSDFGLLIYDESHHSVSKGNKTIVDYFTSGNPDLRVLGATATPDRADEEALGQIFETVVGDRDILFGIDNGWLVEPLQQMIHISGIDFSHVRTTAGDLNGADLSAVMEAESSIQGVVMPTLEAMYGLPTKTLLSCTPDCWANVLRDQGKKPKRTIVFTVSVNQAETLCSIFNRVIPGIAAWVCGKTDDATREQTFKDFYIGSVSILVNCGVTTEGYDNPYVELIAMARPTKSRSLYCQCIGRSTRTLPGLVDGMHTKEERLAAIAASSKPKALILDFVGNSGKHKLISVADILGGRVSERAAELAVLKAKNKGVPVSMTEAMQDEENELRKKAESARLQIEARKNRVVAKVSYSKTSINPFNMLDIVPVKERGWDSGKVLSEKQRGVILKMGINPDTLSYGQGRQLLVEQFRRWGGKLCTLKQAAILKKRNPQLNTKNLSFKAASDMITSIAEKEGWRK